MSLFHTPTPLLINLRTTLYYRLPTPNTPALASYDTSSIPMDDGTTLYRHPLSPITFATHVLLPDTNSLSYPPSTIDLLTRRPSPPKSPSPSPTTPLSSPPATTRSSRSIPTSTPPDYFLRSIDNACLVRIRDMVHYTPYHFDREIDYHVERGFIWDGIASSNLFTNPTTTKYTATKTTHSRNGDTDGRYLSMTGLNSDELVQQVEMIRARGHRDWVRVDMRVEIEPSRELRERTELLTRFWGGGGEGSESSEGRDGSDDLEERGSERGSGFESELEKEVESEPETESETENGEAGFGGTQEERDEYETEIEEDVMQDIEQDAEILAGCE